MEKVINFEEIEKRLLARIELGYGRYISCNKGWYLILGDLDTKLAYLYPDYRIAQIKEKFGTLRFYCDFSSENIGSVKHQIAEDLVTQAEEISSITCEVCGAAKYGRIRTRYDESVTLRNAGWWKTQCDTCFSK